MNLPHNTTQTQREEPPPWRTPTTTQSTRPPSPPANRSPTTDWPPDAGTRPAGRPGDGHPRNPLSLEIRDRRQLSRRIADPSDKPPSVRVARERVSGWLIPYLLSGRKMSMGAVWLPVLVSDSDTCQSLWHLAPTTNTRFSTGAALRPLHISSWWSERAPGYLHPPNRSVNGPP